MRFWRPTGSKTASPAAVVGLLHGVLLVLAVSGQLLLPLHVHADPPEVADEICQLCVHGASEPLPRADLAVVRLEAAPPVVFRPRPRPPSPHHRRFVAARP